MTETYPCMDTEPVSDELMRTRHELLDEIDTYVAPDAPAAELFNLFDPELAEVVDPEDRLSRYAQICADNFDFRSGLERQQVAEVLGAPREVVGEELWDTTFKVCEETGAVGNTELEDGAVVKSIAVLGGTPNAIANRTRYGIEQIVAHDVTVGSLDFLMAEKEVEFAKKEAEIQLGVDLGEVVAIEDRDDGVVTTYADVEISGQQVPVRILTAKATNGRDRATTLDTMRLWNDVSDIHEGDRMVAVTTDLYKGFQEANAKEVITWQTGYRIEVIGHSAEWAGGKRTARQLLQDSVKATVDSRCRLYSDMVQAGMRLSVRSSQQEADKSTHAPEDGWEALRFYEA